MFKNVGLLIALLLAFGASPALALPAQLEATSLLDGQPITIPLRDGKARVFVFVSSQCPCSASHESLIGELAKEFSEFPFFALNSNADEDTATSAAHFRASALPFVVIKDQSAKIADDFAALKTPHAFIVNGKGEIIFSGGVTNSAHATTATKPYLKTALLSVRGGQPPNPREVRALGCVIARP